MVRRKSHIKNLPQILREVFDVIFPTNNQLRALLLSTELWLLYQRRNLIVHRLGIVGGESILRH